MHTEFDLKLASGGKVSLAAAGASTPFDSIAIVHPALVAQKIFRHSTALI